MLLVLWKYIQRCHNSGSSHSGSDTFGSNMVDTTERLQVLLSQEEAVYKTSDYLVRMNRKQQQPETGRSCSSSPNTPKKRKSCDDDLYAEEQSSLSNAPEGRVEDDGSASTQINKHWREKICEWAYQGTCIRLSDVSTIISF